MAKAIEEFDKDKGATSVCNDGGKMPGKQDRGLSRRAKILTTIVIFYGNMTYGCAMNAFSPALKDFKRKFDASTAEVTVVFTASIGCYMAGALLCTFLYNLVNRQLVVVALFVGITATMFIAPFVPNLPLFYCMGGLLGFCIGCYDTAQFVWIMEIWQSASGPFIEAQHFMFALGTMLSPLIMSPFLSKGDEDDEEENDTPKEENRRLFVPFTILGCLCAVTAVAQLLLFLFMRYKPPPPETNPSDESNNNIRVQTKVKVDESKNWFQRQWPGWEVARLVILSGLTLGFYQGMEMCTMQILPTFGQESDHKLSESKSADTLTALTAAFTVGRGVAIFLVVFKMKPQFILFGNIFLVLIGNIIMLLWGNTKMWALWTASILYGLGYSSLLPSFCAWMERYMEFTNTIGALMIVSGSFIGSMYPLIIGEFIEEHPLVITYPIFLSVTVNVIAVFIAYRITRKSASRVS